MQTNSIEQIRIRGARQNNLKGFNLDIPVNQLVVVTGLSGAGKSSLVFETLHAEGQRRYVETFSPYTRQFLELLPEAKVDSIENIHPSIAVKQGNTVKTSRSNVGTMTEICDWMKIWFAHVAELIDPATGNVLKAHSPASIWHELQQNFQDVPVHVCIELSQNKSISWQKILNEYLAQGFTKIIANHTRYQIEELDGKELNTEKIYLVADRLKIQKINRSRFLEAASLALKLGNGCLHILDQDGNVLANYSNKLISPASKHQFRPASPALFSFNSPIGACPKCRGFGKIIEIDWDKIIPDKTKTLEEGVVAAFSGAVYGESQNDLLRNAKLKKIPTNRPWNQLTQKQRDYIINGDENWSEADWTKGWYGIKRFFSWLESNSYKMHVRVFLSRFRAYTQCPSCKGTRFQSESLAWKFKGNTLPQLYSKTIDELYELLSTEAKKLKLKSNGNASPENIALIASLTRLGFLREVGLGFLTLDRQSRTLSGGETQRVNLTSCLGASLSNTLFILDEPSIGLHPRDLNKMIAILRKLVDNGNTVVVVEHDESVMRAADTIIEIGPEPGSNGGQLIYHGNIEGLLKCPHSITGRWLSGTREKELRLHNSQKNHHANHSNDKLIIRGATVHNLKNFSCEIPLKKLVGICGVSGSGKSTLLNNILANYAENKDSLVAEDDLKIQAYEFKSSIPLKQILLIDQSPVSKTPRSNPAVFTGIWGEIRKLLASTPEAKSDNLSAASFSYNSGEGRCPHCHGSGWETVEMQFLSDVFVPCPICEGKRFSKNILKYKYRGKNAVELLELTLSEANYFFIDSPKISAQLKLLEEIGLGYLKLGQALNTLSGGEAQRLKLAKFLGEILEKSKKKTKSDNETSLILIDEPTTGLHREDIHNLINILKKLVLAGTSIIVVEHQTDILKACDWLIELGPEAGINGGQIVFSGTPEALTKEQTATAPFLKPTPLLAKQPKQSASQQNINQIQKITLKGVREHNLKNISLTIPHHQFTVMTGVSGSGKSSLAFDVIFAEGQRRFMECMSAYARQFVEQMPRPELDEISGLPPSVAIEQRITRGNAKSTVATITEVAQYLRLLYAKIGIMFNPKTGNRLITGTEEQAAEQIKNLLSLQSPNKKIFLAAPLIRNKKGHHQPLVNWAIEHGYEQFRIDGKLTKLKNFEALDRYKEHTIELIICPIKTTHSAFLAKVKEALKHGKGTCLLIDEKAKTLQWFSQNHIDPQTGEAFTELDPKDFSWNTPRGWCPKCHGHGNIVEKFSENSPYGITDPDSDIVSKKLCPDCQGARINPIAAAVKIFTQKQKSFTFYELLKLPPNELIKTLEQLELTPRDKIIAERIVPEIRSRLKFLGDVGLSYLTLDRASNTLSGGEAQRIRLAAQLGSNLSGVLYVLDEPSIGLHPLDNQKLIYALKNLKQRGNTLLVVEHDEETMRAADLLIDMGPEAGTKGGELLFYGPPKNLETLPPEKLKQSQTLKFLNTRIPHPFYGNYRECKKCNFIQITKAKFRNLKSINVKFPIGRLSVVCGVSGAGKSTLVCDLIAPLIQYSTQEKIQKISGNIAAKKLLIEETNGKCTFENFNLPEPFRKLVIVDQSPIGKTSRSTPATYIGAFDIIRQIFASLPEAKLRGHTPGFFSFNTKGGRCETCAGAGRIKLEMSFMPDADILCEDCSGTRYSPAIEEIRWNGKNISEVLSMSFEEAANFFQFHKKLQEICKLMTECGLGYLKLGQSSPTLSGGEAQRLKLVSELVNALPSWKEKMNPHARNELKKNCYILEEPTIGLHQADCVKLIALLQRLVNEGHSVIVIEHHPDIIAEADWIIKLGPEGGETGGKLLYQGPPNSSCP